MNDSEKKLSTQQGREIPREIFNATRAKKNMQSIRTWAYRIESCMNQEFYFSSFVRSFSFPYSHDLAAAAAAEPA